MKNQVQLITYVDRLGGGGWPALQACCRPAAGACSAACTCCRSSTRSTAADAGFDPIDHTQVDPRLGDWDDIRALSQHVDVMGDVIVNHMSTRLAAVPDFVATASASAYAGLFLTTGRGVPAGCDREADLLAMYRPRPGLPFTCVTLANGEQAACCGPPSRRSRSTSTCCTRRAAYLDGILRHLCRQRHPHGAARRRGLRDQEAGTAAS
jgi:sucrose phosphorylase